MRILVLTDSLGLPRGSPSSLEPEQTWIGHFKKHFIDSEIVQLSVGGFTTSDLLEQLTYYKHYNPDVVLVQIGIVDCAPRAIRKDEYFLKRLLQLITKILPTIGKKVYGFIRKHRNESYVSLSVFERNVTFVLCQLSCPVFWVSITGACFYENILPGVSKKIILYNAVLKKVMKEKYIDCLGIDDSCFMGDGHHLNTQGHKMLWQIIHRKIKNEI